MNLHFGRRRRPNESPRDHLERLRKDAFSCGTAEELVVVLDRLDAVEARLAALEAG